MQPLSRENLEAELSNAIKLNEFVLYYQPQFNIVTSTFEGIEALIRWQHPKRGLLLPDEFISVAEKSELIVAIGEWTLKTACLQFKQWQNQGLSPIRIAVNVSGGQLRQTNFIEFIENLLNEVNLSPNCLELELSENIIIHADDHSIIQMIKRLNKIGILIALDDFGTGNSSLDYLTRIPVDRIKIDKTYIQNMSIHDHDNKHNEVVVKSLIKLAAKLNIQLVAEGAETLMQVQTLLFHQCKEIQGYYFSEPLPADQVEKFLHTSSERLKSNDI